MDANKMQLFAGMISSAMFVSSSLPMVYKAYKIKDLQSYSLGNIALSNFGNAVHWVYVASLPFGPVWFLHGFNTLITFVMFVWYWRYEVVCSLSELRVECVTNFNECTN
jgi:hypothetical protein